MSGFENIVDDRREEINEQYHQAVRRIGMRRFVIWVLDTDDEVGREIAEEALAAARSSVGHLEAWQHTCREAGSKPVMILPMANEHAAALLYRLDRVRAREVTQHHLRSTEFWIICVSDRKIACGTFPVPAVEMAI